MTSPFDKVREGEEVRADDHPAFLAAKNIKPFIHEGLLAPTRTNRFRIVPVVEMCAVMQ